MGVSQCVIVGLDGGIVRVGAGVRVVGEDIPLQDLVVCHAGPIAGIAVANTGCE